MNTNLVPASQQTFSSTIEAFIQKHPVLSFYSVVFLISWGGFFLAVGPTTSMEVVNIPLIAVVSLAAGPIVAGLLMTALVYGRAGFREFRSRLFKWRVPARWYAIALVPAPLLLGSILLALSSLVSPDFLPGIITAKDKITFLLFNITIALVAGLFEEIGWTGFAVPTLRRHYGVFATGIIAGVFWGAWHFLGNVAAAETVSGTLSVPVFLSLILLGLLAGSSVAFRVLMVWVYDRTGSLLVAILMHMSYTAAVRILNPVNEGVPLIIYGFTSDIAWWIVVAMVAVANGRQLTRQPLSR